MRYRSGHKQQTREQIVHAASRRFRKSGAKGVAIADLMQELRLTHGGFYRHFNSKEQLFAEALNSGFEEAADRITRATENARKGQELSAVIETYLSAKHCEDRSGGCPVAALTAEMPHHPKAVRIAFDRTINKYISRLSHFVSGKTEKERNLKALVLLSGMAGTLNLARAVKDQALRNNILHSARESYIQSFCPQ